MPARIIPGVYVSYESETPSADLQLQGGVVGFVGDFVWGDVNTPIEVRNFADFESKLGGVGTPDSKALYALLLQKPKKVVAVRVVGDGAAKASATLKDESDPSAPVDVLRLEAKYVGNYGNEIKASVESGILNISFADRVESYKATDIDSLVSSINASSELVRAEKLADGTLTDQAVTLSGGSSGSLTDDDYIGGYDQVADTREGLYVLDLVPDVEIVTIGGTPSSSKNSALIEKAKENGWIAVVPPLDSSNLTNFLTEVSNYADPEGHAVVAFPAVKVYVEGSIETVNPAYVVAGLLGRILPPQSAVNVPLYGVQDVARGLTQSEMEQLIQAKVNPITLKGTSYAMRHSLTTGDSAWKEISVRRVFNLIGKNAESILGDFVGEPITPDLWQRITDALNNYLYPLKVQGWIADYVVVCDASNNPPEDREAGKVNVSIKVKPLYTAYYYEVKIEKVLRFSEQQA